MAHRQNHLLKMLSPDDLDRLVPYFKTVDMPHAQVLAEPHQLIEHAYFPHSGVISFVVELRDGKVVETGMAGRDGVMGASQALDGRVSLNKILIQVPGEASIIGMDRLRKVATESASVREILLKYDQFFMAHVQQSVACNASHDIKARMCRWLLRLHDLVDDDFPLTHEFLAQMLGVRRSSISEAANPLQSAGLIHYARGRMRILDAKGLKDIVCECYADVRGHHRRIFGTLN
jgi:CRP-like cAMP-binding protein